MALNSYAFDGTPIPRSTSKKLAAGLEKFLSSGASSTDDPRYGDTLQGKTGVMIEQVEREAAQAREKVASAEANPLWGTW